MQPARSCVAAQGRSPAPPTCDGRSARQYPARQGAGSHGRPTPRATPSGAPCCSTRLPSCRSRPGSFPASSTSPSRPALPGRPFPCPHAHLGRPPSLLRPPSFSPPPLSPVPPSSFFSLLASYTPFLFLISS